VQLTNAINPLSSLVLIYSGRDASILVLVDSIYASQTAGAASYDNFSDQEVASVSSTYESARIFSSFNLMQ
jgi:hypothetical protein